jgi:hypothetical protein
MGTGHEIYSHQDGCRLTAVRVWPVASRGGFRAFAIAFASRLRLGDCGRGTTKMRILGIVALGAALGGCAGDTIKQGMNTFKGSHSAPSSRSSECLTMSA